VSPSSRSANRWAALGFITLAVMTSVIDNSVMTVATPSIVETFQATLEAVEWASSSYALLFGATMLLWGRLGAMYGHRRMFIAGNLVFAIGSALVGSSPTIGTMIVTRAVQGIGAAMYNPASIALIALIFSGRDRPLAYGINGMTASVGIALGYVLGGFCAEYISWRWAFYVNVPVAALAAWGAWRYVPDITERADKGALDYLGAMHSLVALCLIIFALINGHALGWWSPTPESARHGLPLPLPISPAPIALVLGCLLLAAFVRRELGLMRRGREPLFDVTLFRHASFRWGGVVGMLRFLVGFVVNYSITLFLQIGEGIKAFQAGLVQIPNAVFGTIAAPLGGWLANRIGVQRAVLTGLVLQALGLLWIWQIVSPTLGIVALLAPFSLFGLGSGLASAQLNTLSLRDVPRDRTGEASSAIATLRQMGAPFAIALAGLIMQSTNSRLAAEGIGGSTRPVVVLETIVVVLMAINAGCLVMTLLVPNRSPDEEPGRH
jgi:EmrB/QacA subfamily drug resistance transporter